jgi:predicted O-methyltransferase YrrM
MLRAASKYLIYRLFAKHRYGHGIHSPFVYSFIRNVLVEARDDEVLKEVRKWHRHIRNKEIELRGKQYGAGSKYFRKKKARKIKAGKISVSEKYGRLLYHIIKHFRPEQIIELGTGSGVSTAYMAAALGSGECISVEGNSERKKFAEKHLARLSLKNYSLISSDFDSFLKNFTPSDHSFLAFIDGNHTYSATMRYFHFFRNFTNGNTILIFDDIRWSRGMEEAWKEIIADNRVVVSIDLFKMGILFFNPSVTSQNLIINF